MFIGMTVLLLAIICAVGGLTYYILEHTKPNKHNHRNNKLAH